MKPEEMTAKLREACGPALRSVILYGSAAAGDHAGKRSDFNLLVVLEELGTAELDLLSPVIRPWIKAGNPPPLLFTATGLRRSTDVYPIEIADMKASRRVLHGEDVVADLKIEMADLRGQLEHELQSKLILLREHYLLTAGRPRLVCALMLESLSNLLVLFRAALRLYSDEVPARKPDALDALARFISFDQDVFRTLLAVKEGRARARDLDARALFGDYLAAVEAIVAAVDARLREKG